MLRYTDIAVLVVDAVKGITAVEEELISVFHEKKIRYVVAFNKSDLLDSVPQPGYNKIYISAKTNRNINELKEMLAHLIKSETEDKHLVADLIGQGELAVLVVPIDSAAPNGTLDFAAAADDTGNPGMRIRSAVVTREHELAETLKSLSKKPRLVITDSQAFEKVSQITPEDIMLTSFSILFARYKGNLTAAVHGAAQLDRLNDGDTVLFRKDAPIIVNVRYRYGENAAWIKNYTGKVFGLLYIGHRVSRGSF